MQFLSEKLRECREGADMSIDTLMLKLNSAGLTVHTNTLRNWENGKGEPDVSDLGIIASFYKKPIQYFFNQKTKQNI